MTSQTPDTTEIKEVVEEIGNLLQTGEYDKAVAYLHQQLQKAQKELSQERTGFLDHIAKLEKIHQEELQKAREESLRKIIEVRKDPSKSTKDLIDLIDQAELEGGLVDKK